MATSGFDQTFLVTGGVIVAVLLVVSVLLYMLDTWATARSVCTLYSGWGHCGRTSVGVCTAVHAGYLGHSAGQSVHCIFCGVYHRVNYKYT